MTNVILKCSNHECGIYQIISNSKTLQTRKKWQCKVCQLKQSLKRIYAEGDNAPQLRKQCQQMNLLRGQSQQTKENMKYSYALLTEQTEIDHVEQFQEAMPVPVEPRNSTTSKWGCYLEPESE